MSQDRSPLMVAILRLIDTSTDAATLLAVADAADEADREAALRGYDAANLRSIGALARLRAERLPKGQS